MMDPEVAVQKVAEIFELTVDEANIKIQKFLSLQSRLEAATSAEACYGVWGEILVGDEGSIIDALVMRRAVEILMLEDTNADPFGGRAPVGG